MELPAEHDGLQPACSGLILARVDRSAMCQRANQRCAVAYLSAPARFRSSGFIRSGLPLIAGPSATGRLDFNSRRPGRIENHRSSELTGKAHYLCANRLGRSLPIRHTLTVCNEL